MAAQRAMAGTTAINAGSAGVMERSEVKKGGITFGNDNAGDGDAGLSAQTAGEGRGCLGSTRARDSYARL